MIWHARKASTKADNGFGRMLAGTLGFMIALQALMHIAVDLVAAPPTGIGCPFISAGGTRLVTISIATAMILSVTAHRRAGDELPDLAASPAGRSPTTPRRRPQPIAG